jgi:2,4-dienoyl-CoA reductase-like NADH-dependent reductase (Old Yellow Enzyme family)/thioredoxin reductase
MSVRREQIMSNKPNMLARPGKIGTMEIRNRLVIPAMNTNYTYQGQLTDQAVYYYGLRAQGGAGLIILEGTVIAYPIARSVLQPSVSDDKFIPALKKVVDEIHRHETKVALQIIHAGRQTKSAMCGSVPVSCSDVGSDPTLYPERPRALTLFECKTVIERFGDAALRAKKAGFDAVELHLAHGYLGSAFLSPNLNTRTDEYGGMEGGIRFCCDIVREVKDRCGRDYPVLTRLNGDDYNPSGGVTHIDARMIAVALEGAGVDCINVSSGLRDSDHYLHDQSMASPRGSWIYLADGVKKAVNVPVMVVKRISEDMVEGILEKGQADFICVGRPHITDPEYGNKLLSGKADEILPCIWCAQGCYDMLWMLAPTTCLVNPAAGRKYEKAIDKLDKAHTSKRVLVAGGGPSGCMAALVSAKRGHEVILYDKNEQLGGAYRLAARSQIKKEVERLFSYFERALPKAGVQIHLNAEATPKIVKKEKPDAVVIAVGADPKRPLRDKGVKGPNVMSIEEVMGGQVEVGHRVVIWTCSYHCRYTCEDKVTPIPGDVTGASSHYSYACTAGYAATDTAEHLASQGKLVSIVTERETVVPGMGFTSRNYLIKRFFRKNIRVCSGVKVKRITEEGIILEKAGITFLLDADTILISVGATPRRDLSKSLKGKVPEIYWVGDCSKIGNALTAIASAYDVAMKI